MRMKFKKYMIIGMVCMLFSAVTINADSSTTSLQIRDFDKIDVSYGVSVNISKGESYNINFLDDVQSKVKIYKTGKTLVVKFRNIGHGNSSHNAEINIITPLLKEITLSSGGKASLNGHFKNLNISLYSGSHAFGDGSADNLNIKLKSGSYLDFKNFKAKTVEVSTTGGANCNVHATDRLNVSAWFGGNVIYYGNPAVINKSTWFGSHVIRK